MTRAGNHPPAGAGKTLHRGVADAARGAGEDERAPLFRMSALILGFGIGHLLSLSSGRFLVFPQADMHLESITAIALVLAAAVALGFGMSRVRMPAAAGFILVGVAL